MDTVKLDQSFVRHITSDRGDAAIATAILSLAQQPRPGGDRRRGGDAGAARLPAAARLRGHAGVLLQPAPPGRRAGAAASQRGGLRARPGLIVPLPAGLRLCSGTMSRLLGGLRPAPFLRRHWQKEPLFVPGAFPGLRPPVTRSVLFELACRADVESRLVLERGGQRPWEVVHGPQDPRRLRRLPKTHWTLLVQGVDRLLPAVAALTRPFRFLPDWRIDDVMVSFAAPQGSVGPHVDSYDVFLLQGLGQRRWAISTRAEPAFRSGLDLRILRRFRPEESRVLGPGDMLYLPPGVGHHGVALEDGLTFSIGFRAPSGRELLAAALRPARERTRSTAIPRCARRCHPGEITPAALRGLRRLAREALDRELETAIGELADRAQGRARRGSAAAAGGGAPPAARGGRPGAVPGGAARLPAPRREVLLFAEGRSFPLGRPLAFAGPLLSGAFRLSASDLRPHLRARGFAELLAALLATGAFALRRRA